MKYKFDRNDKISIKGGIKHNDREFYNGVVEEKGFTFFDPFNGIYFPSKQYKVLLEAPPETPWEEIQEAMDNSACYSGTMPISSFHTTIIPERKLRKFEGNLETISEDIFKDNQ